MAITEQQKLDVRRWAGYTMVGDLDISDMSDPAQGWGAGAYQTLYHRLLNLTASEESTLISVYITNLTTLEAAIPASSDNLDTDQAAVWTHNRDEVTHRTALFNQWRRAMCGFLGIVPGPSLGGSVAAGGANISVVRG